MFHRIIFLLLIVSSLNRLIVSSLSFNRCADCFQSFSEHRLQVSWSVTLSMFIQTLATARTTKVRTAWPYS